MSQQNNKGVLLYAHNNEEIDYVKIAAVNATMIRHNLGVPVTLVSDDSTIRWARESIKNIDTVFDQIITHKRDWVYQQRNMRVFRDTQQNIKSLPFYNCDHWEAYRLSPYEETLFIDADYLIMSPVLNNCWGSKHDFLINSDFAELFPGRESLTDRIDDFGIRMYWATVMYFKKTKFAEAVFTLVEQIFRNYKYYSDLYHLPNSMFRNDFAFSIALHILNGSNENSIDVVGKLPQRTLYKLFDRDDILKVNGKNDLTVYLEDPSAPGNFTLGRVRELDVHIMNKWAITRIADRLLELYE
jgi:hypothetical protein